MIPINDRFFARPLLLAQPSSSSSFSSGGGGVREHARGTQRSCKLCRRRIVALSSLLSFTLTNRERSIGRSSGTIGMESRSRSPHWVVYRWIDICAALRALSKECAPIAGCSPRGQIYLAAPTRCPPLAQFLRLPPVPPVQGG